MAVTLYDASVALFIQTLGAVEGFMKRGLAHCQDNSIDPNEIVEARLYGDMLPFRFQVLSTVHHSLHAVEATKSGVFLPPMNLPPLDYAGLQQAVTDGREALKKFEPAEINALEDRDVVFKLGANTLPFISQDFLLTFSLPNFHFHATTAYDILRSKGVPLGKRDYMGRPKMKA